MTIPLLLDLIGTLVFALSGALLAVRKDFDIFGVVVLSVSAGLGGGMLRDMLLGATPVAALDNVAYLLAALTAAGLGFFFHPSIQRLTQSIRLLDAFGLGVFAVVGTLKSLDAGLDPIPSILLGVVTGVGGGMLRDLLASETPFVLRREIYALAALLGAAAFAVGDRIGLHDSVSSAIGISATVAARLMALHFNWQAPRPRR